MSRRKGKSLKLKERASERVRMFTFIFNTLHINIDIIDFFHIPMENTTKMKTKWEKQKKNCACNDKKVGRVARRWWSKRKDTTKESGKVKQLNHTSWHKLISQSKRKRKREWTKERKEKESARARAKVQISERWEWLWMWIRMKLKQMYCTQTCAVSLLDFGRCHEQRCDVHDQLHSI